MVDNLQVAGFQELQVRIRNPKLVFMILNVVDNGFIHVLKFIQSISRLLNVYERESALLHAL